MEQRGNAVDASQSAVVPWHTTHPWKRLFFTIFAGQAASLLGSRLVQFALVWWLTRKTGSAVVLSAATLAALLPQIVLGPMIGALIDRWPRRRVMILADSGIALATVGLAVLFALGWARVWHIYVIMFIRSLGGAFHWPAMQASTSLMVPKEHLARVSGLNQTLQGVVGVVGPPLGALAMEALPMQGVLAIDVGTAALAVLPLLLIAIPEVQRAASPNKRGSVWADFREGLRYVRGWPGLVVLIGLAMVLNFLFNPTGTLMPLLITQHFGKGALELGWMDSVWGGGMLIGALTLSVWGGFKRNIVTSMSALVGLGVGTLVVGVSPSNAFGLALAGMGLTGVMLPLVNGPLMAVVQKAVAVEMQGRVFTLLNSLTMLATPISLAIAGPAADVLGVRVWYWLAGGVAMAMGVAGFFIPALMNIEENNAAAPAAMAASSETA